MAKLTLARREQQDYAIGLESPRRERERVGRRPVQPLRVVDDADERFLLGGVSEEAEHGGADQEAIPCGRPREAERSGERGRLGLREAVEPVEDRADELVQRGEREL